MDAETHNEAFEAMVNAVPPVQDVEWIPLAGSRGRVLAHPVRAREGGACLLDAGDRIDSGAVAMLGDLGMFEVDVVRSPRAALAFEPTQAGMIAEAVAAGLAIASGARAATAPLPDPSEIADHLRRLARAHDTIVTHCDSAAEVAIREIGRIDLPASRLGAPWAGRIGPCMVFGLPTAPGAIVLAYALWLGPTISRLEGRPVALPVWTKAVTTVASSFEAPTPYRLARLHDTGGKAEIGLCADPFQIDPASIRKVNAIARLERAVEPGDLIDVATMTWATPLSL